MLALILVAAGCALAFALWLSLYLSNTREDMPARVVDPMWSSRRNVSNRWR